jgi:hypothetical protein
MEPSKKHRKQRNKDTQLLKGCWLFLTADIETFLAFENRWSYLSFGVSGELKGTEGEPNCLVVLGGDKLRAPWVFLAPRHTPEDAHPEEPPYIRESMAKVLTL